MDRILILTHRRDTYTVDRVARALEVGGARPLRVDTDRLPMELNLSLEVGGQAELSAAGWSFRPEEIRALWMRHLGHPRAEGVEAPYREACERESLKTLEAFLDLVPEGRWMDPRTKVREAESKLRQYGLARDLDLGLRVPRTLASNDPDTVRAFYHDLPQRPGHPRMVMKLQSPLSMGMDGQAFFLYTTPVAETDLDGLDTLRTCPLLFQEYIPKARELRVAYVAGRCFAGAVDPSRSTRGRIDCRLAEPGSTPWEEAELPPDERERLGALMSALGLRFGVADFIRTPENEHVFLEVNPCGEWGMLERDLDLPISQAIANTLLETP